MESRKQKCPICGHYTLSGLGSICEVCFWEDGYLTESEDIQKARESYKKVKACDDYSLEYVREPRGIELPGLYESDNIEAQNDPQYLYTKQCYEKDSVLFYAAEHILLSDLSDEEKKWDNTYKDISKEETFKIFNALAYKDDYIGLRAAFNLALCYATGCGCKKDLLEAQAVLDEIMSYFDVNSSKGKLTLWLD